MKNWQPHPGQLALYVGRSAASRRMVRVLAEASGGRMCVEAVGKKGVNVRLTVKRESLRQPDIGLF